MEYTFRICSKYFYVSKNITSYTFVACFQNRWKPSVYPNQAFGVSLKAFGVSLRFFCIKHGKHLMKISVLVFWRFHCMKSVRTRSYSGLHFLAFGPNTERYWVSLRIQSECGKVLTRITPNMNTFCAVFSVTKWSYFDLILYEIFITCQLLLTLIILSNFYMPCKHYPIPYMLDANFAV